MQIALDTFHWNPIMHIFVWGSILSWLVVIPIAGTGAFYDLLPGLLRYVGVAFEVLSSATYWIYLPIVTVAALAPTIIFRIMRVDVNPHIVDDVRLLQSQEGRKFFKHVRLRRKPPPDSATRRPSVRRSGYAFSHTEGFGELISSGRIFGMNEEEVFAEHQRRLSTIISNPTSRAMSPPSDVIKVTPTHEIVQVREAHKKEMDAEIHEVDERTEAECNEGGATPEDPTLDHSSSTASLVLSKIDGSSDEGTDCIEEGKTISEDLHNKSVTSTVAINEDLSELESSD